MIHKIYIPRQRTLVSSYATRKDRFTLTNWTLDYESKS